MSLNLNNPLLSRSLAPLPSAKAEMPADLGIAFKDMTDKQRREFLTTESQRLQQKPDRSADENTKLALILDFLGGTLDASGLKALTDLYSSKFASTARLNPGTPQEPATRPENNQV